MTESTTDKAKLPLFAGVDVGGTNIKVGVVDDDGNVVQETKFPTRADQPPQPSLQHAADVVTQLVEKAGFEIGDVAGVGLGTPGPMDIGAGKMLTPNNLPGWHNANVRDMLSEAMGQQVAFANDAGAAAFGEYWVGGGRDYDSTVLLTLGTGVGAGIIYHGMSIDGDHSHGAEAGHIVIDSGSQARLCGCGIRGHLEAYASATAVVDRTREALDSYPESKLNQMISETSPLSALMVAQAASAGDDLAARIVSETAGYLARGIAILAHIINPAAFILGGAMNFGGADDPLGRKFLDDVVLETRRLVFPIVAKNLVVDFAQLGSAAGFIGAAGLAREAARRR